MNKIIIVYLLTLLALVLSACGLSEGASTQATAPSDPAAAELPTETKLLLGTFKLEGTEQSVTAEQAAELLPLWQVYSGLLTSDTAAQAEIDALIEQIQDTMTPEQMKAINAMELTQQDVFAVMQEQGVGMSQRSTTTSSDSSSSGAQSGGGMAPPDGGGGMPMGNPPDGGGDMPMGNAGGSGTTNSDAASAPAMNPSSMLIEALIELLQNRIAS